MSCSYLISLPTEILYRIFDNLDVQTIVRSLRYVCKRFYLTTNSYNRYHFNFKSLSKPDLLCICRLISFENVISLTLSDEDKTRNQIQLFLSLFDIEKFVRLQSLALYQINEAHLNIFAKYVIQSSLKTLSISTPTVHSSANTTQSLLSMAITHSTIKNLILSISPKDWNALHQSINLTLEYVRITNNITLSQYCLILQYAPNLRTLVVRNVEINDSHDDLHMKPFRQLTSLIFENGTTDIQTLQRCLSLTPSLTYLKLSARGLLTSSLFDGFQLKTTIQNKVSSLRKFEFFFHLSTTCDHFWSCDIGPLMRSFRTPFWLDHIQCYITCDFIVDSRQLMLYSLPICNTYFVHYTDMKKISSSNFESRIQGGDTNNVQELQLHLTKDLNMLSRRTNGLYDDRFFHNVNNLTIENTGEWPLHMSSLLSTLVHVSNIRKLSLCINFTPEHLLTTLRSTKILLCDATNLHSLLLFDYWAPMNPFERISSICSLIPSNVKHLQIRVKNIHNIEDVLENLKQLTSVTFEYAQILTIDHKDLMQSLECLPRYSSLWDSEHALHIWFGQNR